MFGFFKNKKSTANVVLKDQKQVIKTWLECEKGYLSMTLFLPAVKDEVKVPVAIVMHGIMASQKMYTSRQLGNFLADEGIAAITFDFNGHGKSYGKFNDMTILNEVEDAMNVYQYATSLDMFSKIVMIGHSQGGVVTSLCAGRLQNKLDGIVLLAPAAVVHDDMHNGTIMNVKFDPANPPDTLWVMLHPLGKQYILTAKDLDIYGEVAKYTGPMCLIHGKKDKIVPFEYSIKYNEACKQSKLILLDDENHMLNVNKSRLFSIILDFLKTII